MYVQGRNMDADRDFASWKEKVNRYVVRFTGVDCDDLPDEDYWYAWNEGTTAKEMALDVAATNGYSNDE